MSTLVEQRVALETAITAVTGVTCYEQRPKAPKPGDAWLQVDSIDLLHGLVWSPLWRVFVHLPQQPRDADAWVDTHFQYLVDAIRGPGFATEGAQFALQTEVGEQYVLQITARSE